MSLISTLRSSRGLSFFAIWLVTLPLMGQQANTQQQGSNAQTQQGGSAQAAQSEGITPSMLVVPPAPKFPKLTGNDYSKAKGYWPNPFAPYEVRNVPEAGFGNVPKLEDLIHE